jgi:hypothetical protein
MHAFLCIVDCALVSQDSQSAIPSGTLLSMQSVRMNNALAAVRLCLLFTMTTTLFISKVHFFWQRSPCCLS